MKNNQKTFVEACLERLVPQLVGLTITGGVEDETGEFWGFTAKGEQDGKTVEKTVFVLSDSEGNGPGFLEINDGMEPDAPAFTEYCPYCSAEVPYEEPRPFICPVCQQEILPCSACCMEGEPGVMDCAACPWETAGKEAEPCLQH